MNIKTDVVKRTKVDRVFNKNLKFMLTSDNFMVIEINRFNKFHRKAL